MGGSAGDVAQLGERLSSIHRDLGSILGVGVVLPVIPALEGFKVILGYIWKLKLACPYQTKKKAVFCSWGSRIQDPLPRRASCF